MNTSIKNCIASYKQWRKGVLFVGPLEIVLIVVVIGLFVLMIFTSLASNNGKLSMNSLKSHLLGLQPRLQSPYTMDPEWERENMERLLNKVKANCEEHVISSNFELKELFDQTCTKMNTIDEKQANNRSSWLQLKGVTNSFQALYYPGIA